MIGNMPANDTSQTRSPGIPGLRYFLGASVWALLLVGMADATKGRPLWLFLGCVLIIAMPIFIGGLYGSSVRQIRRLEMFQQRGWLFRLLSGRPLRVLWWMLWALGSAFFMLLQFQHHGALEWSAYFLVIPVFWLIFNLFRHMTKGELRPYLVTSVSLSLARFLVPLVMLLTHGLLSGVVGDYPAHESLEQALRLHLDHTEDQAGSALTAAASRPLAWYEANREYLFSRAVSTGSGEIQPWYWLLYGGVTYLLYFNACAMLACFLMSVREYRRLLGPLTNMDDPPPLQPGRIGMGIALLTFITLFLYLPGMAYLEAWLQQHPQWRQQLLVTEQRLARQLESIDDRLFRQGTLAQLDQARLMAMAQVQVSMGSLDAEVDRAFAGLAGNVDLYLDWYYSLGGEYARIATLLSGDLQAYMARKLEEKLGSGEVLASLQASLNQTLEAHDNARDSYRRAAQAIMAANQVTPESLGDVEILRSARLDDILSPPVHGDMIRIEQRMMVSSGGAIAGAVSAVVMQKVVAKVFTKNTFQLAAKAMGKVAAGKTAGSTAGAGAGAAAGAAIGSIVPGLGTALGAVVGGMIGGIVVGISVDKALIMVEEAVSREDFRAEILAAIEEARGEFRATLGLSSTG
jgi:hypothetical protein